MLSWVKYAKSFVTSMAGGCGCCHFWDGDCVVPKYCHINKKREKSTLSAYFHIIFSRTFRYAGKKKLQ